MPHAAVSAEVLRGEAVLSEQNRVALATMGSRMKFCYLSRDKLTFCCTAKKIVTYRKKANEKS